MCFKFVLKDFRANKGKIARDEKNDIVSYIDGVVIEAGDEKKAVRAFTNMINGRLSKESGDDYAVISLPDYGNCQIVVEVDSI